MWLEKAKVLKEEIIADLGDEVICDLCNGDYTGSNECGGVLMGGYAICPRCVREKNIDLNSLEDTDMVCPDDVYFWRFVLWTRNGDNTIKFITEEDIH